MLHIELFQAAALFFENLMCKENLSSLNTGNDFMGPVNIIFQERSYCSET